MSYVSLLGGGEQDPEGALSAVLAKLDRGKTAQARPWLESTTRFQSLIAKKDTQCFQLEPLVVCLSVRRYTEGMPAAIAAAADTRYDGE